ncbi:putative membrane protein [Chitinivorax tropicus]|uniref:Putative membrane protein n=1 Tax=Chitinivorax tropicus TaxID=714531 RepID=A0A840MTL5_9PROT|nr:putative membrane protein [Chitinivorax tropicus]
MASHHLPGLDEHFSVPEVHHVAASRPLAWLKQGWQDLMAHPGPSLIYGVLVATMGWLIVTLAAPRPYLVTAAVSGFLLIAPLIATGVYELTRQRANGRTPTFLDSLIGLRRNASAVAQIGIVLALAALAWERISAILLALFYGGEMSTVEGFVRQVLFSGDYTGVVIAWFAGGGLLAALVFSLTVIGMPMLIDRDTDVITAMMTSLRTVADNVPAMLVWAGLIVALTAIGFATLMLGLIVILPWLGHATWCAYQDLLDK